MASVALTAADAGDGQGVFASARRPPAPGCLSTLEAIARALDACEGTSAASTTLLKPLRRAAQLQNECRRAHGGSVRHRKERPGYVAGGVELDER